MDVIDDGRRRKRRDMVENVIPVEGDIGENTRDVMDCVSWMKRLFDRLRGSFGRAKREHVSALRAVVDLELVVGSNMTRAEHEEPEPIHLLASDYTLPSHVPHCVVARGERRIQEEEQTHHGCSRCPRSEGTAREAGSVDQLHSTRRRPGDHIQKVISFTTRSIVLYGTHNLIDGIHSPANQIDEDGASNTQYQNSHDTEERPLQRSGALVRSVMNSIRSLLIALSLVPRPSGER